MMPLSPQPFGFASKPLGLKTNKYRARNSQDYFTRIYGEEIMESNCHKENLQINSSQIKNNSSSFSLHCLGTEATPLLSAFTCQAASYCIHLFSCHLTLCIVFWQSQTSVLKNFFHFYGCPHPAEAAAITNLHQPYALVHTAFFLNSGRTLKDNRVAFKRSLDFAERTSLGLSMMLKSQSMNFWVCSFHGSFCSRRGMLLGRRVRAS